MTPKINKTGECPVCEQRVRLNRHTGRFVKHNANLKHTYATPCPGWGAEPVTGTVREDA